MKAGAAGKIYVVCDIRCTGGAFFKIIQKGLIHMKKINIQKSKKNKGCKCKDIIKNVLLMLVMIAIGVGLCLIIKTTFTTDILIPAVMVFSVFLISVFTDGYVYGILASVVSVIIVNFAFTFPYFKIDFLIPENITSAIIMIAIAFITCGFTSKIKHQEMLKKESEMEKMRANLLRAVSHDFRTPLTTIYGASSALIESGSEFTDEQKEKMLRGIQQDSQWLYRMVENLLSVTRLDGDINLIKTPIALDELIDSVLIKFAKRYPDQEVEVDLPDELVIIPKLLCHFRQPLHTGSFIADNVRALAETNRGEITERLRKTVRDALDAGINGNEIITVIKEVTDSGERSPQCRK